MNVFLAQMTMPDWAPLALQLAGLVVVATSLVVLIIAWRNNRDR